MHPKDIERILRDVRDGRIDIEEAMERFKTLPYEDLGYAKLDHHRHLRRGVPEVIFCQGKTIPQIVEIVERFDARGSNILATRANKEAFEAVRSKIPSAKYNETARMIVIEKERIEPPDTFILVACGGTSDLPVAEEAAVTAEVLGNKVERLYDVGVAGLHRLLRNSRKLHEANVVIAVAGMEGALASVVSGLVDRPVIAVPTSVGYGASFGGLSALLTMLNSCSPGISVVNIDNGFGAGYLASMINRMNFKRGEV
ncbi:MAG: nickel pincer cofactor biosynthesis protein LarB [bacterium]